jgi:hypothetical protein
MGALPLPMITVMQYPDEQAAEALGPFAMLHDLARLQYGRLLWKRPASRERLLRHWTDPRHPYAPRFAEKWRPSVEEVLQANPNEDLALDARLKQRGLSLRVVVREIPPVFGSFFGESRIS